MRHVKQQIYFWGSLLLALAISTNALAAGSKYKTEKERLSYAIGVQIGGSLKQQGFDDIDPAALGQAVADVLSGAKLKVSKEDMQAAVQAFQNKKMAEHEAQAKANQAAGDKFRAKNKKKKGVKVTKDGIQYEVLKKGTGKHPTTKDTVTVHYTGKLINGKVFDSSVERGQPATFPLDGVIKGWTEILPMMKVGSKWRIVIPPELAYGERGAGHVIGPNATLIFEIELLSIKS
jgi:FKBP-type peptidyl-prolyl cis-trans isomerase FklB